MALNTPTGTYLVTGATSGIGSAVARALARRGHTLHIVGRDTRTLEATRRDLLEKGARTVQSHTFDLGKLVDIRRFATLPRELPALDGVVLAAGIIEPVRRVDANGLELNYLVNHLSKFALLEHWAPSWAAAGTRLVVGAPVGRVTSTLDDPMGEQSWSAFHGVKVSQYANDIVLHELNRLHESDGLRLVGWNPGSTRGTQVARKLPALAQAAFWLANVAGRAAAQVGEQGAQLATRDSLGSLTWVMGSRTIPSPARPSWATDQRTLWSMNARILASPPAGTPRGATHR